MHFKDLRVHSTVCVSKQIIAPDWKRGCVAKSANYDFNFWEKNSNQFKSLTFDILLIKGNLTVFFKKKVQLKTCWN